MLVDSSVEVPTQDGVAVKEAHSKFRKILKGVKNK